MNPDAVIFDLFGTIVEWRVERLPRIEYLGQTYPSTIPFLLPLLEDALGKAFDRDAFIGAHRAVYSEINAERREFAIEITCETRFQRTLKRIGSEDQELATRLTRRHMEKVREVTEAPPVRVESVRRIARHHRVALLSNFDDSTTGHEIVSDTGLADLFESVVISADLPVRKPHPDIYHKSLADLDCTPEQALFVGDTPEEDILGAHRAGLPSVWLSEHKSPYPSDLPSADFEVPDLSALPELLGIT